MHEADRDEPIWAKDPVTGKQEFGKETFQKIYDWYCHEGAAKLVPAVCSTKVDLQDPNMDENIRKMLTSYARIAARGWAAGNA